MQLDKQYGKNEFAWQGVLLFLSVDFSSNLIQTLTQLPPFTILYGKVDTIWTESMSDDRISRWSCYIECAVSHVRWQMLLCGCPSRLQYGSCPSVCLIWAPNSKVKMYRKPNISVHVPQGTGVPFFSLKDQGFPALRGSSLHILALGQHFPVFCLYWTDKTQHLAVVLFIVRCW